MPDTTRTFVAVAVPPSLTPRLERLQTELAGEVPEARWAATPPFHVTLAFLGDVPHAVYHCSAAAGPIKAAAPGRGGGEKNRRAGPVSLGTMGDRHRRATE